jgi:hypothetical protein
VELVALEEAPLAVAVVPAAVQRVAVAARLHPHQIRASVLEPAPLVWKRCGLERWPASA